jgi:uncharacterized membrane protein SpoIIM required for sporulation
VIVDVRRFVEQEEPYWKELEQMLDRLDADMAAELTFEQSQRLYYLYQRASAGLARMGHMALEPAVHNYLQPLVARAYAEIHHRRDQPRRLQPLRWFLVTFPQTFRRRGGAFLASLVVTMAGVFFGAIALALDEDAKPVIMPFPHLLGNPSERVAMEESATVDRLEGNGGQFSAMLMTNNTRVSITTMALGIAFGIGSILLLFYNGVILGAVAFDYLAAGEGVFLLGWLLPHGAIEIPAILIAGQAGLVIGAAVIGYRSPHALRTRLRMAAPDIVTLIFGVGLLLVWAGIVESFLSQYHAPVLPYWLKISFGALELALLFSWLCLSGRRAERTAP